MATNSLLQFPRAVADTKPRAQTANSDKAFARPFLELMAVDPAAAIALRRMAIDFNDHRRFGGGMRYGDWQGSAKRRQINRRRDASERAYSYRGSDWDD